MEWLERIRAENANIAANCHTGEIYEVFVRRRGVCGCWVARQQHKREQQMKCYAIRVGCEHVVNILSKRQPSDTQSETDDDPSNNIDKCVHAEIYAAVANAYAPQYRKGRESCDVEALYV